MKSYLLSLIRLTVVSHKLINAKIIYELLKVLQGVDDFQQININWQGNFKDTSGNSNVGSAMTVMVDKDALSKVDFENFDASKLKEIAINYGTHNDFK